MTDRLSEDFTTANLTDQCPLCGAKEGKEFWANTFHAMTRLLCDKCGLNEWVWND